MDARPCQSPTRKTSFPAQSVAKHCEMVFCFGVCLLDSHVGRQPARLERSEIVCRCGSFGIWAKLSDHGTVPRT
eukprot:2433238-Amphidinium_carterae.1